MNEVWWVNAFVGNGAEGNATCVVFDSPVQNERDYAAAARALRAPDTAFINIQAKNVSIRFFSPWEGEMAFCGQGFIAADSVLRRAYGLAGRIEFLSQTGNVTTLAFENSPGHSWFEIPRNRIQSSAGPEHLGTIIDSGRRRLFRRMEPEQLKTLQHEPAEVMHICKENQLSGLCYYAYCNEKEVDLRVFTVSLDGKEDASTGGAVAGLAALLPRTKWKIRQGSGNAQSRGELLLDNQTDEDKISVGGRVDLIANGQFAKDFPRLNL